MAGKRLTKIQRAQRMADIFDDRLSGLTIRETAAKRHCSTGTVQRDIDDALAAIPGVKAEAYRKLLTSRYERLLGQLAPLCAAADVPAIKASGMMLDHLRRMHGLDAPSKSFVERVSTDPTDVALRALVEQVEQRAGETTDA